jgi:DivIVA domain-containing protein
MGQLLILLVVALVAAALVFGVVSLITGGDQGLEPAEPDGMSAPLPVARPLAEGDLNGVRFDTALRGYRMAQVDQALRRAAYDIGYKEELINVLQAEVLALREQRFADADALRAARESASQPAASPEGAPGPVVPGAVPGGPAPVTVRAVTAPDGIDSDGIDLGGIDVDEVDSDEVDADGLVAVEVVAEPASAVPAPVGERLVDEPAPVGQRLVDEADDARDDDSAAEGDEVSVTSGATGESSDAKQ